MPYYRPRRTRGYSAAQRQEIERRRADGLTLCHRGTYTCKEEIKRAGGLWDSDGYGWAMPDVETYNRFAAQIGADLIADPNTLPAGLDLVQPARKKCGSCESLISLEYGVEVIAYYAGPVTAANYENCPTCDHAFQVS